MDLLKDMILKRMYNQFLPKGVPGLIVPGNIDIYHRPEVMNPDGSRSTVRSMSFNQNNKEVLVPTVTKGSILSDEDAIKLYNKYGQHLGIFNNPDNATDYANKLHQQQEWFFSKFPQQLQR